VTYHKRLSVSEVLKYSLQFCCTSQFSYSYWESHVSESHNFILQDQFTGYEMTNMKFEKCGVQQNPRLVHSLEKILPDVRSDESERTCFQRETVLYDYHESPLNIYNSSWPFSAPPGLTGNSFFPNNPQTSTGLITPLATATHK
jgi:hypothetical protein